MRGLSQDPCPWPAQPALRSVSERKRVPYDESSSSFGTRCIAFAVHLLEQLQVRQISLTHKELVDAMGGAATFADRPDDQALAAAHVAGREDAWHAGHV